MVLLSSTQHAATRNEVNQTLIKYGYFHDIAKLEYEITKAHRVVIMFFHCMVEHGSVYACVFRDHCK